MYRVVISTYLPKFSLYIRINQQEALSTGKPLSEEDPGCLNQKHRKKEGTWKMRNY